MGQETNPGEDQELIAKLKHIEYTMVALVSKLDTYMEVRPTEF